jgi:hypothetical protein
MSSLFVLNVVEYHVNSLVDLDVRLLWRLVHGTMLILVLLIKTIQIVAVFKLLFDPEVPGLLPNLYLLDSSVDHLIFKLMGRNFFIFLIFAVALDLVLQIRPHLLLLQLFLEPFGLNLMLE